MDSKVGAQGGMDSKMVPWVRVRGGPWNCSGPELGLELGTGQEIGEGT